MTRRPIVILARIIVAFDRWQMRVFGTHRGAMRLSHLAAMEAERHEWERAIYLADCAVRNDPHWADGYRQLGYAYLRSGDIAAARAVYERGRRAIPDDARIAFQLGELELEAGRDAAAERALRGVLAVQPDHTAVMRLLGHAVLNQGRIDEARVLLERTRILTLDDAHTLMLLGRAAYLQDDFDHARTLLTASIERERGNAYAHYLLAQTLAASGSRHEALDSVRRALRLDPQNASFREFQETLRMAHP